jgi:hypothetical protein
MLIAYDALVEKRDLKKKTFSFDLPRGTRELVRTGSLTVEVVACFSIEAKKNTTVRCLTCCAQDATQDELLLKAALRKGDLVPSWFNEKKWVMLPFSSENVLLHAG